MVSWRNVKEPQDKLTWDDYIEDGIIAALEESRQDRGHGQGERARLLRRRHAARRGRGGARAQEAQGGPEPDAAHHAARFLRRGRHPRLHRRELRREAREAAGEGRHRPRHRARELVLEPARQRPRLDLRGQQLPEGQGAARLRPALLELGLDQPARPDVRLLHPQHLPREQARQARCAEDVRRAGEPEAHQGARVRVLGARGPHRAVEGRLRERALPRRPGHLRARRQRPHRGHDQPGEQEQAQLLGQRQAGRRSREVVRAGEGSARKLVAQLVEVAQAARRQAWWPRARSWAVRRRKPIEPAPGRYAKERAD